MGAAVVVGRGVVVIEAVVVGRGVLVGTITARREPGVSASEPRFQSRKTKRTQAAAACRGASPEPTTVLGLHSGCDGERRVVRALACDVCWVTTICKIRVIPQDTGPFEQ